MDVSLDDYIKKKGRTPAVKSGLAGRLGAKVSPQRLKKKQQTNRPRQNTQFKVTGLGNVKTGGPKVLSLFDARSKIGKKIPDKVKVTDARQKIAAKNTQTGQDLRLKVNNMKARKGDARLKIKGPKPKEPQVVVTGLGRPIPSLVTGQRSTNNDTVEQTGGQWGVNKLSVQQMGGSLMKTVVAQNKKAGKQQNRVKMSSGAIKITTRQQNISPQEWMTHYAPKVKSDNVSQQQWQSADTIPPPLTQPQLTQPQLTQPQLTQPIFNRLGSELSQPSNNMVELQPQQLSPLDSYTTSQQNHHTGTNLVQQPLGGNYTQQAGGNYVQHQQGGNYIQQQPGGTYVQQQPGGTYVQQPPGGTYVQQQPGGTYVQQQSEWNSSIQQQTDRNYIQQQQVGNYGSVHPPQTVNNTHTTYNQVVPEAGNGQSNVLDRLGGYTLPTQTTTVDTTSVQQLPGNANHPFVKIKNDLYIPPTQHHQQQPVPWQPAVQQPQYVETARPPQQPVLRYEQPVEAVGYQPPVQAVAYHTPVEAAGYHTSVPYQQPQPRYTSRRTTQRAPVTDHDTGGPYRVVVTNLHPIVTQDDLVELFGSIGALKRARLVKPGLAEILYMKRDDAMTACKKYHMRELDGQPMQVNMTSLTKSKGHGYQAPASLSNSLTEVTPPPPLESTLDVPTEDQTKLHQPLRLGGTDKPGPSRMDMGLVHKALFKTSIPGQAPRPVTFTVKI